MKRAIFLFCIGMMVCLSSCQTPFSAEDHETDMPVSENTAQESLSVERVPEEESGQNPGTVISPYSLSELGYRLEIPEDIGIYDMNEYQEGRDLIHQHFDPPLYYVQEEETTFQYGTYFFASYGGDNLVGVYTVLHPQCMYTAASADTMVCLSLLQAFLRSDVEREGAQIKFLRTEETVSGAVSYVPYTLSPGELETYQVYEDEEIVVYDFLGLTSAPPLDEQLKEDAQGELLEQKGIDLSWIFDMRDYFLKADGGIGRFLSSGAAEEPSRNYVFSMTPFYTDEPHELYTVPEVYGDTAVCCDIYQYLNGRGKDVSSNVMLKDVLSGEETKLDLLANKAYLYNGELYYQSGYQLCKMNAETGEKTELFTIGENPAGFSFGGEGFLIYWAGNAGYSDVKIYSYDIEKEKTALIAETNYLSDPSHEFKIREGHLCFAKKEENTYTIYGFNVRTGKTRKIAEGILSAPNQMVYNGSTLLYTTTSGTHVLTDGSSEELLLEGTRTDCDILENRYIFYFNDRQLYIYDLKNETIVYTTAEEVKDFRLSPWLSLDTENKRAALLGRNDTLAEELYPDWNEETGPDFIYLLQIEEA
mgnify:CR=1 FL=1